MYSIAGKQLLAMVKSIIVISPICHIKEGTGLPCLATQSWMAFWKEHWTFLKHDPRYSDTQIMETCFCLSVWKIEEDSPSTWRGQVSQDIKQWIITLVIPSCWPRPSFSLTGSKTHLCNIQKCKDRFKSHKLPRLMYKTTMFLCLFKWEFSSCFFMEHQVQSWLVFRAVVLRLYLTSELLRTC